MQGHLGSFQKTFLSVGFEHVYSKDTAGPYEAFWLFGNAPKLSDIGVAFTDAYTLLNASIGGEIMPWKRLISRQISAHNLLNEGYRDFLDTYKGYVMSFDRKSMLKAQIPFTFFLN